MSVDVEQLLADASAARLSGAARTASDELLIIDPETRQIAVPENFLLGVESDQNVERVRFQCPKIVGDNIDLSKLHIYVNYQNANQEVSSYWCQDVEVEGDNITFSWLVSRAATMYQGETIFIVCAKKSDEEGNLTNEWNTTIPEHGGIVLEGLEPDPRLEQQYPDVIEQILTELDTIKAGGGSGITSVEVDVDNTTGTPSGTGSVEAGILKLSFSGLKGDTGSTPNIQIGTVQTLDPGQDATASMTGTPENPLLNLGIPKGGGSVDPEQIKQAVNGYLEENPVSGMTPEQEQQLNQNTEDISSLSEEKVDFEIIRALVSKIVICFQNVAWINEDGQNYVESLINSFNKNWNYKSILGKKLSEYDYVSATIPLSTVEEIKDGYLHLYVPKNISGGTPLRYDLKDDITTANAKLTAKVRFNSIPISKGGNGFRLQLSNGSSGVQIFQINNLDNLFFVVYEGNNPIRKNEIELKRWYELSVEISNGYQIVCIDRSEILRSNILSTNYCTKNSIILQNTGQENDNYDSDVDIEWISYESTEV